MGIFSVFVSNSVGCLILLAGGILGGLLLLLRLRMILESVMRRIVLGLRCLRQTLIIFIVLCLFLCMGLGHAVTQLV
jgi:hypothetical protein